MNCDFQFTLSSVVCKPDQRPILDFGEDQKDIFLSEAGLIRGKATLNFEICCAHLDRLAHLKKSRNKWVCCGVPGHLTSHLPGRPDPHGNKRVTSLLYWCSPAYWNTYVFCENETRPARAETVCFYS